MKSSLPKLDQIKTERARRSLSEFIKQGWHVVEPATPYVHGWHLEAISDHLEAVTRGEIRNLIINIPPRHMKSLSVCVFWPAWVWASKPEVAWLFSSHAEALAIRDNIKARRLMQSAWYQQRWGHVWKFAGDQNQKVRYENNRSGYRLATGVAGGATGEGGDIIVADDPLKAQDAYSDVVRTSTNEWWDETMSTRGNNPKTVARVIIMQRLHQDDLTGHVLERMKEAGADQYVHLCLPAEFEPNRFISPLGWVDPRQKEGELLWPARFGREELDALKSSLTEQGAAGQLQQRPAPKGGAIFKKDWWQGKNRYKADDNRLSNQVVARWISLDTALKDGQENDYTSGSVLELTPDYRLLVRTVKRDKLQFPNLLGWVVGLASAWNRDGKLRGVVIEDKTSGTSLFQTLAASAEPWLVALLIAFVPHGSKTMRARQASNWCEKDCVWLPEPSGDVPWLFDFEEELFKFPTVAHDDQVDTLTQGIIYLENFISAGWHARNGAA